MAEGGFSHAFALGDIAREEVDHVTEVLSDQGITIITNVPIGRTMPHVNLIHKKGVNIAIGNDNIYDSWSPFDNGDLLKRAGHLAEVFNRATEFKLAESIRFITGGKKPLDNKGKRIWPKVGDEAIIVLTESSFSAEAIARKNNRSAVLYDGKFLKGLTGD
ncbi:amidohydrolase family protein [Virgibacillus oceani]